MVMRELGGRVRGWRCRTWEHIRNGVRSLPSPLWRMYSSPLLWKPRAVKRWALLKCLGRSAGPTILDCDSRAEESSSAMLASSLSTIGGFGISVSQRFSPTRTSPPTFSRPPFSMKSSTAPAVFGWISGSMRMPMPSLSLYSENGVTARSKGNTSEATSLALLISRGSKPYSLQMRMSEPSVPPAQSESHGVIWDVRESKRVRTCSMTCWRWLYSSRASFWAGVRVRAESMAVLSLCVPFFRYAQSMTRLRYPSAWPRWNRPLPTWAPRPLKSWLWM
mmetsp:Transcript_147392/g.257637  ORF Transcript_147392/g.257637 Transcript_147392/m.257637 type:complete len:277 (+) Transcript_147392:524-1354(+)